MAAGLVSPAQAVLHCTAPTHPRHCVPSYRMSKPPAPKIEAKIVQGTFHWSRLSLRARVCAHLALHTLSPAGGISFLRHFYLCGFQVTLSGKVYWSSILPETAAKASNHFLSAQLRNCKCAVLQNSVRTLSLLPLPCSCRH